MTLGYLGPEGTFSQQAARDYDGAARHVAYPKALAHMDGSRTGSDKTSVCFDYDRDGPGTLHGTLGALATRGINMVKIESRPDKRSLGRYVFLVDIEGHRTDPAVAEALEEMRTSATMFKVLGSYPKAAEAGVRAGSTRAADVG